MLLALPGGVIGQRLGERRVVLVGLALMVVGSALTAMAGDFTTAAAGRLVSGIGAVLMNILLPKLIADWFAGKEIATAMAVVLTSWPVGLGLATATLGALAAATSWRTALLATAGAAFVGFVLMLLFREAPRSAAPARARLTGRDVRLGVVGGVAWGCFNASLVTIIAFGPGLLIARGMPLADAGWVVSLAIWLTMISVPVGGLISDRLGRPTLVIVVGSLIAAGATLLLPLWSHAILAFTVVGLAVGPPPGPLMTLIPRAVPTERATSTFGVFYTVFYLMMALTQPIAGFVRDRVGTPDAPIVFAAAVMVATVLALGVFRRLERIA
jgi:MFS family permease